MEKYWQWCEDFAVVTDDKVPPENTNFLVVGKLKAIAEYAEAMGLSTIASGYETVSFEIPQNIDKIIETARSFVAEDKQLQAYYLYKIIFTKTLPPFTSDEQRQIHAEACVHFARYAANFGRAGTAYDWYKRATSTLPENANYRLEMIAKSMKQLGLIVTAWGEAKVATEIEPDNPDVWHVLGNVENLRMNEEGTRFAYDKYIETSKRSVRALIEKMHFHLNVGESAEAEELSKEILLRSEEELLGEAFHCRALMLMTQGKHEEAIECFMKALEIGGCDKGATSFNLSLSLQAIGRYKESWKYASFARSNDRSNLMFFAPFIRFKEPMFNWQPAPAVVHIHTEAGVGDNIAIMRWLPLIKEKGYTVRFEVREELLKLAQDSFPDIEVVKTATDWPGTLGLGKIDYHLPILEVLAIFDVEVDTVPWYGPYAKADPKLAKKYGKYKNKIGIVWSSGIRHNSMWMKRYGHAKSLSFDKMSPIIDALGEDSFVSLQVGPPRDQLKGIADPLPSVPTWAETAALIENLDMVITPDTGTAHLAAAMGKPTWVMMHDANNTWHFMCERPGASWNTSSPWYPSVKLYRQKTVGDWSEVITRIATDLKNKYN